MPGPAFVFASGLQPVRHDPLWGCLRFYRLVTKGSIFLLLVKIVHTVCLLIKLAHKLTIQTHWLANSAFKFTTDSTLQT